MGKMQDAVFLCATWEAKKRNEIAGRKEMFFYILLYNQYVATDLMEGVF